MNTGDPFTDDELRWLAKQGGGMALIYVPPQPKGGMDINDAQVDWIHFDWEVGKDGLPVAVTPEYLVDCAADMVRAFFEEEK